MLSTEVSHFCCNCESPALAQFTVASVGPVRLHNNALPGHLDVVMLLVKRGAKPNMQNKQQKTVRKSSSAELSLLCCLSSELLCAAGFALCVRKEESAHHQVFARQGRQGWCFHHLSLPTQDVR